jgi:alanine-synthesizing transaminase
VAVDPDRIFLTASTSEAYAWLFKLLCDPGDAVLVPRPSYPLFSYLARLESVDVVPYALAYDGEWHLSADAVREGLGARTRAVVVVSPNNPTGSYLKRMEADALLALCAERGLAVVSDEVFADYAFAPDPRRVASLADDGPALAFSLGGLSKSCGLPQLKLAWIAVSGPETWRAPAIERLEVVADTYLSVSTPVQLAAGALLARRPELQGPIAERVAANRGALRRRLGEGSPATMLAAEGGWSAVVQVPATQGEDELVARLLEEHGVLVHPGYFFDFPREAFLVLSLLPPPETFADGVDRILAVL